MPRWQNFLKTDFRFHKKSKVTKTDSSQITSKDFDFHKLNFEIKLLISKKKKKKKKKKRKRVFLYKVPSVNLLPL